MPLTANLKVQNRALTAADALEGVSLLLIEDDDLIRESLLDWLASVLNDPHLIGAPCHRLTALACILAPQVIVADIALSDGEGVDTVRKLRRVFPAARIVALVRGGESQPCAAVLGAGADGCLLIWDVHDALVPILRRVVRDQRPRWRLER